MKNLKWENIYEGTTRAWIYGGWLVKSYEEQDHYMNDIEETIVSMCFVPDPSGEWVIDIEKATSVPPPEECNHPNEDCWWEPRTMTTWCRKCNTDTGIPF